MSGPVRLRPREGENADDRIGEALRDLPRQHASPAFTDEVLARLDTLPQQRPRQGSSARPWQPSRLLWAAAVMSAVGLGYWLSPLIEPRSRESTAVEAGLESTGEAQRIEALYREYEALDLELQRLQRVVADSQPVVRVLSDGEYDYLLDLRPPAAADGGRNQLRPVAYAGQETP